MSEVRDGRGLRRARTRSAHVALREKHSEALEQVTSPRAPALPRSARAAPAAPAAPVRSPARCLRRPLAASTCGVHLQRPLAASTCSVGECGASGRPISGASTPKDPRKRTPRSILLGSKSCPPPRGLCAARGAGADPPLSGGEGRSPAGGNVHGEDARARTTVKGCVRARTTVTQRR